MTKSNLNRRDWLTNSTWGLAGGTLLAAASNTHSARAQDVDPDEERKRFLHGECPQILRVSKSLEGTLILSPHEPCPCRCEKSEPPQTIFRVDFRTVLRFKSSPPCDETNIQPLLQDGVELWAEGSMELRLDKCPNNNQLDLLFGHSRAKARVHRYRPNEDIFEGEACATVGFDPSRREDRCCAAGLILGSACLKGVNKMADWSLTLTSRTALDGFDPGKICSRQELSIQSLVDGVLIGPCMRIPRE